ncbi:MAG: hypothetical protein IH595_07215 [Bacteroidales bacterium]|nr:hypothetical protein [Bacteroidales bacterium]
MKQPVSKNVSENKFLINQLSFLSQQEEITVGVSPEPASDRYRIHYRDLPGYVKSFFPDLHESNPYLYLQFDPSGPEVKVRIKLSEYPEVAQKYYTAVLFRYFLEQKTVVKTNFIKALEVWVRQPKNATGLYPLARYNLKAVVNSRVPGLNLRVAFDGFSYIQGMHLMEMGQTFPEAVEHVTQVVFERQVYHIRRLPQKALMNRSQVYPILNRRLASALKIIYPFRREMKKHSNYISMIESFKTDYLRTDMLDGQLSLSSGWMPLDEKDIFRLETSEKNFLFANRQPASDIHSGLLTHGPYRPLLQKQIRVFFMYHEKDAALREKAASYLNGNPGGAGLSSFTKTPTLFDPKMDIVFRDMENPVTEILPAISSLTLEPDCGYLGIYLSPYDKTVTQAEKHRIYYLVKEALLQRNIAPQTIDAQRMQDAGASFRYWIPNLAMAITAKLGGVPWVLNKTGNHDLVVGFGLYSTSKYNLRIVGSSVCFSEDGIFEEFDFFPENENYRVAVSLEKAILRYLSSHKTIDRLVIHYYKEISNKAFQPIREMINRLQPGMPVIVVRINSSLSEYNIIQDTGSREGFPYDGSYFHLGNHQYVFYINRHEIPGNLPSHLPMPVQLGFKSNNPELLNDGDYVKSLMKQVYLFSKLYWRSLRQPAIPVTVSYPRMLAGNAVWFERQTLPDGMTGLPWFL